MNILVCIKQVLDDSVSIGYDEVNAKITPDNVESIENAFDTYALEMATRLKESAGDAHITLLSVGNNEAKVALKNGLAVGGDEASLVVADNYQDSTALDTAKTLSQAIKAIEEKRGQKFDIIFTGKESTDVTTGQVGVILSSVLDMPILTDLIDISLNNDKIVGSHETDSGVELIESDMPCVVTVGRPDYDPRYATIKSKMAARKKPIDEINDIALGESLIVVKKTYERARRQAGLKISGKPVDEAVAKLMEKLLENKVL